MKQSLVSGGSEGDIVGKIDTESLKNGGVIHTMEPVSVIKTSNATDYRQWVIDQLLLENKEVNLTNITYAVNKFQTKIKRIFTRETAGKDTSIIIRESIEWSEQNKGYTINNTHTPSFITTEQTKPQNIYQEPLTINPPVSGTGLNVSLDKLEACKILACENLCFKHLSGATYILSCGLTEQQQLEECPQKKSLSDMENEIFKSMVDTVGEDLALKAVYKLRKRALELQNKDS